MSVAGDISKEKVGLRHADFLSLREGEEVSGNVVSFYLMTFPQPASDYVLSLHHQQVQAMISGNLVDDPVERRDLDKARAILAPYLDDSGWTIFVSTITLYVR